MRAAVRVLATLAAMLGPALTSAAGCARSAPCDGVSCAPSCPRDATIDPSGRCACIEGDVALLGACVPLPVAEAFCGPAARIEVEGAPSGGAGCVFRSCGAGQSLDVASGACAARGSLAHGGSIRCTSPAVAIVAAGQPACVAPEAACPRGTRAAAAPDAPADGLSGRTCDRPLACPPGSLAEGSTCRPVVTAGGRAGSRVDVGAWAALALGIHGGPGSAALCQPLAQRPDVFERSPAAGQPDDVTEPAASRPTDGGADGGPAPLTPARLTPARLTPATPPTPVATTSATATPTTPTTPVATTSATATPTTPATATATTPTTVRISVAILLPDQDISRLHAEVRGADASGRPLSPAAEALVSSAAGTALEALRGLGGEASAASVELEVHCAIGPPSM
jgi:hypothetical protein